MGKRFGDDAVHAFLGLACPFPFYREVVGH